MSKKKNVILRVGEFYLSQYTKKSILIYKDEEAMEIELKTLRKFWKENY